MLQQLRATIEVLLLVLLLALVATVDFHLQDLTAHNALTIAEMDMLIPAKIATVSVTQPIGTEIKQDHVKILTVSFSNNARQPMQSNSSWKCLLQWKRNFHVQRNLQLQFPIYRQ